jgi:hypothetical protein
MKWVQGRSFTSLEPTRIKTNQMVGIQSKIEVMLICSHLCPHNVKWVQGRSFLIKVSSKCLLTFSIATFLLGFCCGCAAGSNSSYGISSPIYDGLFTGGQPELVVLIVMLLLGFFCGCAGCWFQLLCGVSSPTNDRSGKSFVGGQP